MPAGDRAVATGVAPHRLRCIFGLTRFLHRSYPRLQTMPCSEIAAASPVRRRRLPAAMLFLLLLGAALAAPGIAGTAGAARAAGSGGTAAPAPPPAPAAAGGKVMEGGASDGDLARIKARGRLIAAVFPIQESRFLSVDLDVMRQQGLTLGQLHRPEQFKGIEIELLKGFADWLGVPLELNAASGGIADTLQAVTGRQADLAASGLIMTPTRQKEVDFSAPYYSSWLAVVVRRDSRIAAPADLAGKRAAVINGSSHLEFLRAAVPDAKIELLSFHLEALLRVDEGQADFTLLGTNDPPGGPANPTLPSLKIAFRLRRLDTAIALRKGSDLTAPLDAYISSLRQSGELTRLLARHGVHETAAEGAAAP